MQGLYYAIFVISILIIIRWYVRNERSSPDGSTGLLAMRQVKRPTKFNATSSRTLNSGPPKMPAASITPIKSA